MQFHLKNSSNCIIHKLNSAKPSQFDELFLQFVISTQFQDHECTGRPSRQVSDAGRAALARQNQPPQGIAKYFTRQQSQPTQPRTRPNTNQLQGNLSEDEALARALQASMSEVTTQAASAQAPTTQEEQDRMLAMALAQSEQEARRQQQGATNASGNSDKCSIS